MKDIYDEFRKLEEIMNNIFGEIWGIPVNRSLLLPGEVAGTGAIERYRKPFIDVIETDKDVVATADLPGLEKENIKINLTEDRLEISAESKSEEEKKEEGYIYKERNRGCYFRSVSLPSSIDPEHSKATYNNGVLQVTMPKTEIKKKTPLKIE